MIIVKDTMVLIHLAKLSLLDKSCDYFENVLIPEAVHQEVLEGKKSSDVPIIEGLIKKRRIQVKKIKDKGILIKIYQFNIRGGEAEVIALYWQEKANFIATDDDNVRKKKLLLDVGVIGTPSIVLKLYKEKRIDKYKMDQCINELQEIGWFSNVVLDEMRSEVKNE